jgi:Flp pilus assembly protein TadG
VSRYARQALRDEEGQVLVFVVLAAGMLIAMLALVVDVGGWFQAQRRAQSVADAAALAAAPQLIDDAAGVPATVDAVADQNWSGVRVTKNQTASAITVVARPPVGGVLSPFGHFLTPNISASATASIQAPATLSAVAPIVVVCSGWCDTNTRWSAQSYPSTWKDGVTHVPLHYVARNPSGSTFAPIQLDGVTRQNFGTLVLCDATAPSSGTCNKKSDTAPGSWGQFCLRNNCRDANRVANALSGAADGTVHLVAIARDYSGGAYQVVGWGAGRFSNVSQPAPGEVDLEVTFLDHPLLVDGKWVDTSPSGAGDFGVRAIALTG